MSSVDRIRGKVGAPPIEELLKEYMFTPFNGFDHPAGKFEFCFTQRSQDPAVAALSKAFAG